MNLPKNYAWWPISNMVGSLGTAFQKTLAGIEKNFNLVQASTVEIVGYLKYLYGLVVDLTSAVDVISKKIIIIEDTLDGIVNAALFNRGPGNTQQLNAATIIEAAGSITGLPKTLYLKRGTWMIDANVDLSAMGSSLLLAPGAEIQQVGSFTFKLPLNVTIPDQGFHFSGDSGFIIPKTGSKIILDPRSWGALETSDSTDALIAFEEASYAQASNNMWLPAGDYGMDGTWEIRQGVSGYGVTITQLDATVQTNVRDATIYATLTDNLRITGDITIESIYSRPSLTLIECNRFYVEGVKSLHCVDMGFYSSLGSGCKFKGCASSFIEYAVTGVASRAADGYYHTGMVDMVYEDCYAYDFRRIGFTSEGSVSVKSKNVGYLRCIPEYANNEDDSTTEYNGGIWMENTNGGWMRDCIAKNIGSDVGQNSRRPRAYTIGSGFDLESTFVIDNCKVVENTGAGMIGFQLYGSLGFGSIVVSNAYIDRVYQGIAIGAGMNSVRIENLVLNDITGNSNAAGVIIAGDPTLGDPYLKQLSIDGVVETNCAWDDNGGTILFFTQVENCDYTLKNAFGIYHATKGPSGDVKSLKISDAEINYGCTVRPGFSARSQDFTKVRFIERVTGTGSLAQYTGTDETNHMSFTDCEISFVSGGRWQVLGTVTNLQMKGCNTTGGRIRLQTSGEYAHLFMGNTFSHDTNAAIEYFTGGQTGTCRVIGNQFIGSGIPLQDGPGPTNSCPATAIVTSNFYSTAAGAIHNWTAAVSVNNNIPY